MSSVILGQAFLADDYPFIFFISVNDGGAKGIVRLHQQKMSGWQNDFAFEVTGPLPENNPVFLVIRIKRTTKFHRIIT